MKKITYIIGVAHSGSTILDMSLGCHSRICGLGEVVDVLNRPKEELESAPFSKRLCSCGRIYSDCKFWKDALPLVNADHTDDLVVKYKKIIKLFSEKYGDETILVDSSKMQNDALVHLNTEYDLRLIYLIRDVRSWCYSRQSRHGSNMISLALRWFIHNLRIERFLKKENLKYMLLGYEEFALYPHKLMPVICGFLGIDYDPAVLQPENSQSHVLVGNVMRGDKEKRKGIYYDARWLTSMKLNILSSVLLPILRWNKSHVYSNFMRGSTRAFGVKQEDFVLFGDARKEKLRRDIDGHSAR